MNAQKSKTPASRVARAFDQIPRSDYVPEEIQHLTHRDAALAIGYGQTISQPTTVRMMLTWLDAQPGDAVLDVGSGSGWTTALLATIVGRTGKVFAVERIPELMAFGRQNCQSAGIKNAQFFLAEKTFGLVKHAPYDRILVSAAADTVPEELVDQLKPGGALIIPVHHDILEIHKTKSSSLKITRHPGFVFVPLING